MAIKFHVGSWVYTVRVADRLMDAEGRMLMGRADEDTHELLIDSGVKPTARLAVMLHELRHAWGFHVGEPDSDEGKMDLAATVTAAYVEDYKAQHAAIDKFTSDPKPSPVETPTPRARTPDPDRFIEPVRIVSAAESSDEGSVDRAQCSVCQSLVGDRSILTSEPYRIGRWAFAVDRTLYCPHCDALQHWVEGFTDGRPNDAIVERPRMVYDQGAILQFISDHPAAVGVVLS